MNLTLLFLANTKIIVFGGRKKYISLILEYMLSQHLIKPIILNMITNRSMLMREEQMPIN